MRSIDILVGLGLVILFIWVSYLNVQIQQNGISISSYMAGDILNSIGIGQDECPLLDGKSSVLPTGSEYSVLFLEKERKFCFYEID